MVRRRRAAARPGAAIDQEPDHVVPDAAVGVLARADRGGRRAVRAGERLRLDLDRSAVRRERNVLRIRASAGWTRTRREIARAIFAHRTRAMAPSAGPGTAHRRNPRRVRIQRWRDFRIESKSDRQLSHRSICRALAFVILASAIAILQGCASRQAAPSKQAPVIAAATASAKPTPTGAPLGTHAP